MSTQKLLSTLKSRSKSPFSMSKSLFAVFGATGNQGNSSVKFVLSDPELSQRYNVRAISRDISSAKMQELKSKGAELVQADLDDQSTLPAALKGAESIFLMTTTQYQGNSREIETRQAKAVCEEAIKQGVKYIIWSSMSHPFKISGGKLKNVEHFDDKAEIEQYIRGLPIKSAFFAPGSFMQNLYSHMVPRPSPSGDGSYVLRNIGSPEMALPMIDITDTGKWIGAILANPDKYEGKFFAGADRMYTIKEICETLEKVTGKKVTHANISDETYKSFLPPAMKDQLYEMWVFQRDYGYFGPETAEMVRWTRDQARAEPHNLEEFLRKNDYKLE